MPLPSNAIQTTMLIAGIVAALGGCTPRTGPEVLTIDVGRYDAAFDAAVESARQRGLTAALRDRRAGIIETEPRIAGSIFEPWRVDNDSFGQSLEHTLGLQRRRARFEFAPAGFGSRASIPASANPSDSVSPVDPLVTETRDLSTASGELELRVWVYVERASQPGERRSTWTRHASTRARSGYTFDVEAMKETPASGAGTHWTTVARDAAYERLLLSTVQAAIRP